MKVFIAGPYKSNPEQNIRNAIIAADEIAKLGHTPFIPHLCHFWDKEIPHDEDFWYNYCLDWIESCDALIRLPGESTGADNELKKALSLNIPVYFSIEEFKMFLNLKIRKYDER